MAGGSWDRFDVIASRLLAGDSPRRWPTSRRMHPWFLDEWSRVSDVERELAGAGEVADAAAMAAPEAARHLRRPHRRADRRRRARGAPRPARAGVRPVFKAVDSCAAEVEALAPYYYSAYEQEDELRRGDRESVVILGAGPNRIGQGIEFDYCCVQAAQTFRALGYDAVMVNCNPETVSTDADSSDRLYFEPLTVEDVLEVIERERPIGVVAQFGGQTPLRLARRLEEEGVKLLGTPFDAIDIAEDRERFGSVLDELGLQAPDWGIAADVDEAAVIASGSATRCWCGPPTCWAAARCASVTTSRCCGRGRCSLPRWSTASSRTRSRSTWTRSATARPAWIGAVMQHVEEAGVHSGDSACVIPTLSLGEELEREIRAQTAAIAVALGVRGLINVQFAVQGARVFVIEANPRASRTVPFVAKATGATWSRRPAWPPSAARRADRARARPRQREGGGAAVPAVLRRRPDARARDALDRRGDGHRPGLPDRLLEGRACGRPAAAREGPRVPVGLRSDKAAVTMLAALLQSLGFELIATSGTARALRGSGSRSRACRR